MKKQRRINDGLVMGVLTHFDQWGLLTQWYWPPGTRGKLWNFMHGKGWRVA